MKIYYNLHPLVAAFLLEITTRTHFEHIKHSKCQCEECRTFRLLDPDMEAYGIVRWKFLEFLMQNSGRISDETDIEYQFVTKEGYQLHLLTKAFGKLDIPQWKFSNRVFDDTLAFLKRHKHNNFFQKKITIH